MGEPITAAAGDAAGDRIDPRDARGRELWQLSACEAMDLLLSGKVTPLQLVDVAEARWRATDPAVNAMPVTCWERARARAAALAAAGPPPPPEARRRRGCLWGLPVAVKDLHEVRGLPFTQCSRVHAGRIGARDDAIVERLEAAGAIIVGKTNSPEFGAGSQTFNNVYGTTVNPFDTTKTVGGSSGGSAAALACGQVWLATGTDLGGSLRNPASYCSVLGLRPSAGIVPQRPPDDAPSTSMGAADAAARLPNVSGPMARCAADLALMLDAIAGPHADDPCSSRRGPPEAPYIDAVLDASSSSPSPQLRVAWSADLGGVSPIDREVAAAVRAAAEWFAEPAGGGARVEHAADLDMRAAPRVFATLRAAAFRAPRWAELARDRAPSRSLIKPELLWQVEQGSVLTEDALNDACAAHNALLASAASFFERYDLLVCPAAMLPPFDASVRYPTEFDGVRFATYIDWMAVASSVSLLDRPALCVPVGFTRSGLPLGAQFVGRSEHDVLRAAALFEAGHEYLRAVPRSPAAG